MGIRPFARDDFLRRLDFASILDSFLLRRPIAVLRDFFLLSGIGRFDTKFATPDVSAARLYPPKVSPVAANGSRCISLNAAVSMEYTDKRLYCYLLYY